MLPRSLFVRQVCSYYTKPAMCPAGTVECRKVQCHKVRSSTPLATFRPSHQNYPRQELHLHQLRALDAASLLVGLRGLKCEYALPGRRSVWAKTGASDRVGYLHDPLYKSGTILRHAGIEEKEEVPRVLPSFSVFSIQYSVFSIQILSVV